MFDTSEETVQSIRGNVDIEKASGHAPRTGTTYKNAQKLRANPLVSYFQKLGNCRRLPPVTAFCIKSQREIMCQIRPQECYRSNQESLSDLRSTNTTYDKEEANYTIGDRQSICLQ